jgi:hypothetical protein
MLDPKAHSEKTASNRAWSTSYLREFGIDFVIKMGGAHLIVNHNGKTINFWPGTGLFMADGLRGRGIMNLVKIMQGRKPWKIYGD